MNKYQECIIIECHNLYVINIVLSRLDG